MAILKCGNGHFYDDSRFEDCPHCASISHGNSPDSGVSVLSGSDAVGMNFSGGHAQGEEVTVSYFTKSKGMDPVTGWLVCVEGPERGRDYRLHSGRNFVGRSPKMSVCIGDDPEISRENHCSIVFEPVKGIFLISPGLGTITQLNGKRLDIASPLGAGDKIRIGRCVFEFIPYCGEGRKWE